MAKVVQTSAGQAFLKAYAKVYSSKFNPAIIGEKDPRILALAAPTAAVEKQVASAVQNTVAAETDLATAEATKLAKTLANDRKCLKYIDPNSYRPPKCAAGVEIGTKKTVEGFTGEILDRPLKQELKDLCDSVPEKLREAWLPENCAEIKLINKAMYEGIDLKKLKIVTVDTNKGIIVSPCKSCLYIMQKLGIPLP
ncbi:MAG: hypothetical protein LBT05_07055 [Planctomycetaceae bacterium]|nr:hypothetical protein [Planctomycetaceae bacterium]